MNKPVLELRNVYRGFDDADRRVQVLNGASVKIEQGELVALVGPSGAGKSTLLHIAGLLEQPDEGIVALSGMNCTEASENARTQVRCEYLGFVYQFHHLLPEFSALENVVLPQMIAGKSKSDAKQRAEELLGLMNLSDRLTHRPSQLSGGEQQRAAIARALANKPSLILADEPTGNLDPNTSDHVFKTLLHAVREQRVGGLIATHNLELASRMDRVIMLEDGQLKEAKISQQ